MTMLYYGVGQFLTRSGLSKQAFINCAVTELLTAEQITERMAGVGSINVLLNTSQSEEKLQIEDVIQKRTTCGGIQETGTKRNTDMPLCTSICSHKAQ